MNRRSRSRCERSRAQAARHRPVTTAPGSAATAPTARPGLAPAAPALRAELAEDVDRLGMEAARAPLALVRQLVRMHAHVAHQGGIGNAGVLADLSQGEEI